MDSQWLLRQNRKLKEQISSLRNRILCLEDDSQTSLQIVQKLKQGNSTLQNEIRTLKGKLDNQKCYYEQREKQFEFVIRKIEQELVDKGNQYEKLENKIAPLIDTDTVRLKVLNQVEYPHRLEIEAKDQDIQRLKEEVFNGKRKVEQMLTRMESLNLEHERTLREARTKHKIELDNARIDIESLKCAEAVKSSQNEAESVLKQDIEYYQQCYLRSEETLKTARQEMQKMRNSHDQKIRELASTISGLNRENSLLKEGSKF